MQTNDEKIKKIEQQLASAKDDIHKAQQVLETLKNSDSVQTNTKTEPSAPKKVEGVFDGNKLVDKAGKSYDVSPDFITSSGLVVGDFISMDIDKNGETQYSLVSPVPREGKKAESVPAETKDNAGGQIAWAKPPEELVKQHEGATLDEQATQSVPAPKAQEAVEAPNESSGYDDELAKEILERPSTKAASSQPANQENVGEGVKELDI